MLSSKRYSRISSVGLVYCRATIILIGTIPVDLPDDAGGEGGNSETGEPEGHGPHKPHPRR